MAHPVDKENTTIVFHHVGSMCSLKTVYTSQKQCSKRNCIILDKLNFVFNLKQGTMRAWSISYAFTHENNVNMCSSIC